MGLLFLQLPLKSIATVGPQNRMTAIDWEICACHKR